MVQLVTSAESIPSSGVVCIDFFATWCGPCKRIAPLFEEFAAKYKDITFLKVDVDESAELVDFFGISAMPTFVFLKDSTLVKRIEGADARAIVDTLESFAKVM